MKKVIAMEVENYGRKENERVSYVTDIYAKDTRNGSDNRMRVYNDEGRKMVWIRK